MAKNLMVCANSKMALRRINESEGVASDKYVLEGVFAELDKLNRNRRVYPKDEYLKHLSYLRDDIKKNGGILGELDHPEDRFEVKIKEASHIIKDLWYDESSNCVMGKIELLNTPNGLIAKSLVDQNIPLHISSRAAGTVGNDNKVNIQQIYTYDLVCKPGFAGAVLHRVNESEEASKYTKVANDFLNESNRQEALNVAEQFGFDGSELSVREVASDVKLRKEAVAIKENTTDTVEDKINVPVVYVHEDGTPVDMEFVNMRVDELIEAGIIEDGDILYTDQVEGIQKSEDGYYINPIYIEDLGDDADIEISEYIGESLKDHKRSTRKPALKSVFEEDREKSSEKEDEKSDDEKSEDEKEKSEGETEVEGVEILSVSVETESDEEGVEIKDINTETGDEGDDDSSSDDEGDADEKPDTDDKKDEGCNKEGEECDKTPKNALFDCDSIKKEKSKFEEEFAELVDTIKSRGEKKKADESLTISKYPTSAMLTESNFNEFVKLDESQKSNVAAYLKDTGCFTPESINENWKNGLNYKVEQEVWLKYAPADYRKLYESSRDEVKESIRNCASYVLFENQRDVNNFWYNCTILESEQRRLANEEFIKNMPKINESANTDRGLPYSQEYIDRITSMALEYNN